MLDHGLTAHGVPGACPCHPRCPLEGVLESLRLHQVELEQQNHELRVAQQHLEDSRARYLELYDMAPVGYCTADLDGRLIEVNLTGARLLGVDRADLLGCALGAAFGAEGARRLRRAIDEAAIDGEARAKVSVDRGSHGAASISFAVSAVRDAAGRAVACRLVFADVTEQVRAETERRGLLDRERAARAEAELASQAKDDLLAMVSHELRTPLAALLMWGEILKVSDDPKTRARAVDAMLSSARSQARLIDDLLDVARAREGGLSLEFDDVELGALVQASVEAAAPAAAAKGVSLEVRVDAAHLRGDAARLRQVLDNLVGNAIKYGREGGRVTVTVAARGAAVELRVDDDGDGIDPGFLPLIFEPFRQEDPTSTRARGGLGLGLSIVRDIVTAHRGAIEARSGGKGRGASFVVTLPDFVVEGDAATPGEPVEGGPTHRLDGVFVLLVDDDLRTCQAVGALLEARGANVMATTSVSDALRALGAGAAADVVVTDLSMPGRDGFALLRALRARDARIGVTTPVVAHSALASDRHRRAALAAGFAAHVAKPTDPDVLVAALAAVRERALR